MNMNPGMCPALLVLNVNVSFNTIDHHIQIDRLPDTALKYLFHIYNWQFCLHLFAVKIKFQWRVSCGAYFIFASSVNRHTISFHFYADPNTPPKTLRRSLCAVCITGLPQQLFFRQHCVVLSSNAISHISIHPKYFPSLLLACAPGAQWGPSPVCRSAAAWVLGPWLRDIQGECTTSLNILRVSLC